MTTNFSTIKTRAFFDFFKKYYQVAHWDADTANVIAQDYTLSSRQECDSATGQGVCPDTSVRDGGESIQVLGGTKSDGVLSATVRRRINTGDRLDLVINPNSDTYVVWAVGPLNERGQPAKHYQGQHATVQRNERLRFGRTAVDNCPAEFPAVAVVQDSQRTLPGGMAVTQAAPARSSAWRPQYILGNESDTFIAVIGPSGGRKGYSGVTGKPSWGLVWYVAKTIPMNHTCKR